MGVVGSTLTSGSKENAGGAWVLQPTPRNGIVHPPERGPASDMSILSAALLIFVLVVVAPAWAAIAPGLYDGVTGQTVTLEQALQTVRPGHVVVVSEQHDVARHHENQLAVLRTLKNLNLKVSVGLEFLSYPNQPWVDRYVRGEIEEADFQQAIRWAGYPFEWYRPLMLFPREAGGQTRALNAPERLTRALGDRGLAGLSHEERSWLPPNFQLGNDLYFERFATAVREHGDLQEDVVRNFFAAQSAWDDTMAWQARAFLIANPDQVLVIIVGDFHASYGGGLPDRLRARGVTSVLVISQVNAFGLSDEEIQSLIRPDPRHGMRADFVWLTQEQISDFDIRASSWLDCET